LGVETDPEEERTLLVAGKEENVNSTAGLSSVVTKGDDITRPWTIDQNKWVDIEVIEKTELEGDFPSSYSTEQRTA
jgi:hypothetical protein